MKRLIIAAGIMVLTASAFAFQFGGSGGGGKRYNVTVSKLEIKGPAWSAAENYSSTTTRQHGVTYGESTWIALVTNINQTPTDGSAYWAKYIAQGPTGPTGAKGDTGTVTASTGLTVVQRQHSSHSVTMYPPLDNDPTGARPVTWTVSPGSNRAGQVAYSSGKLLVDGAQITGTGGGGQPFTTISNSVQTNMSSGKFYAPTAFVKHTLPLAGANKYVDLFARMTSAHISTNSETGVIRQLSGITSTAGYTVRVPKGSLYKFVATQAGYWEAFKLIGSDMTQYIADFIASFTWSPTSKSFGNVATNAEVYQMFTATNTGNGSALNSVVAFLNQSSAFRLYSSTCAKAVFKPNSTCRVGVAFKPTGAGTWTGTKLNITADGLPNKTADLGGTGTASGPETLTPTAVNPVWAKNGGGTNLTTLTDNDDTTYFSTSSSATNLIIDMNDVVSGSAIASVRMCARMKIASGSGTPRLRLFNGATYQSFSPDPVVTLTSTSFTDYCTNNLTTNPYTSGAWAASDLNALQWVVNSGGTISGQEQVSKVWAEVNF